jgi:hypothetical protein
MVLLNVEEVMRFSIMNKNKVILVEVMPSIVLNVYLLMVVHMTDLNGNVEVVEIPIYIVL